MKTNSQIHKEFLTRNVAAAPVGQMEKLFFGKASKAARIAKWKALIAGLGATPVGHFESDLIKQLLALKSLPVKTNLRENMRELEQSL